MGKVTPIQSSSVGETRKQSISTVSLVTQEAVKTLGPVPCSGANSGETVGKVRCTPPKDGKSIPSAEVYWSKMVAGGLPVPVTMPPKTFTN